jgi:hypothetical protein
VKEGVKGWKVIGSPYEKLGFATRRRPRDRSLRQILTVVAHTWPRHGRDVQLVCVVYACVLADVRMLHFPSMRCINF